MRTTKPDWYSERVKLALVLMRTGVITPKQFSARISYIYLLWRAAAIAEPHSVSVAALRDYWWRQAKRANT